MPVKSFCETVCGWAIKCRAKKLTAQEICKGTEEGDFELVSGDIFRWPKMSHPVAEEGTNGGLRFTVRDGDGFGPAGKAVHAGKEESVTV